ncbi:sensor domain-containing diguanylate cyclase [Marinospirillum minutulum]|uniref:sensor domain-containing diguanylate cyclase n=1 Tax=Marinospirillum minutulum TaxID=64974 RepID=UPI0004089191|nr:diguanylate cyclase [Marinospirillum minutulum]
MPEFTAPVMPDALLEKLKGCKTLPSLPIIALKIIELARSPSAGTSDLAELIASDPSLSAKILSAANSVFYGSDEHSSLQHAINRMGMDSALSLALSFGLTRHSKQKRNGMCLDTFWKRSVISGMVVREVKKQLNLKFDVETTFLAAIIQDIGMLALNELDPDIYGVIFHSSRSHRQLASFEEREYGTCHLHVGYWLGTLWGLPEKYTRLIASSHQMAKKIPASATTEKVLALSGLLADPWVSDNQEMAMTLAYQASQDYLGMDEQQFSHLLLGIQDKLPEVTKLFEISAPAKIDTYNLLQEAKQLLVERNLRMMQKLEKQQREIDELRKNSEKLKEQLKKDPLTGIFNRQFTEKKLNKYFATMPSIDNCLAVVFIDLDFFKTINDQYGHALGDAALRAFASTLEQELDVGCMAGRYGGEEFVVLMPGYSQEKALIFAKRLQEHLAITPLLSHNKEDIYISASMGLAVHDLREPNNPDQQFEDADSLVKAADQAMYSAKRTGRNRILLYTSKGFQDISSTKP